MKEIYLSNRISIERMNLGYRIPVLYGALQVSLLICPRVFDHRHSLIAIDLAIFGSIRHTNQRFDISIYLSDLVGSDLVGSGAGAVEEKK